MEDLGKEILVVCAIVVAAVLIVVLVIAFIFWCRRNRRYDYTPLLEDQALPQKLRRERESERNTVREEALINCQFYLRSHSGKYSFVSSLPNIGTRLEKHWFLVRKLRRPEDLIMNVWKSSSSCPVPFDGNSQKTIRDLFHAISHPYVWPVVDLDLWEEQGLVITVQRYERRGSLKDHIYGLPWSYARIHATQVFVDATADEIHKVSPDRYVEDKYGAVGRPLPSRQLKLYGLQILQALVYLEEQGFPFHSNIHSGNVMLQHRVCRLAGYENAFLGYHSQLYPVLEKYTKDNLQVFDSLSFGHLMYEMGAGVVLTQAIPDRIQLKKCTAPGVKELLEYIFDVSRDYPSIRDISEHEFFVGVRLKQLEKTQPKQIQVTPAMKTILRHVRRGRKAKSKGKHGSSRSKKTSTSYGATESRTPTQAGSAPSSRRNSHVQEETPPPAPPPPPPAPAPGVVKTEASVPEVDANRSALLSQIREGKTLRKVENPRV